MIRVANAPCSWGILEFAGEAGCAPPRFDRVLDEIRETGYEGTELGDWGFMPTDPQVLRHELEVRRLALVGAFVPVALASARAHGAGRETALRTARLMHAAGAGDAFIVLSDDNARVPAREQNAGRILREHGLDDTAWSTFAHGANAIAHAVLTETGLRTVFHPHCGGYIETPIEIDELMWRTDPSLLGLVLDTGHVMYGGGEPLEVFRRHVTRVWHVHFKDCDSRIAERARREHLGYLAAVRAQLFCQLGEGSVDFPAITRGLRAHDYHGWVVVEQDVFPGYGTPAESARRSREFLRGLGFDQPRGSAR